MYYHDNVALNVKCIILYLYKKIKKFKTHRYSQSKRKKECEIQPFWSGRNYLPL